MKRIKMNKSYDKITQDLFAWSMLLTLSLFLGRTRDSSDKKLNKQV